MALAGIIFLTYFWYKIYKRHCMTFTSNMKILLYLQFITGTNSVFIPIAKPVYGIFSDFATESKQHISNIHITGFLSPKLRFAWKQLFLINNLTGNRISIQERHKLSWINAFRLRRLVKNRYAIMLVLIHEKDIVRIKPNYILGDSNFQTHDPNLTPIESLEYI
jgi:hypothetical protein